LFGVTLWCKTLVLWKDKVTHWGPTQKLQQPLHSTQSDIYSMFIQATQCNCAFDELA